MMLSFYNIQRKNKTAGIKNAIIYQLLGVALIGIFGVNVLNALVTNVWFNITFFVLLVVFAVYFLGAF